MKKISINPGCITCGACEFIAPDVFEVTDVSRVKTDVNIEHHFHEIDLAIKTCPVQVIVCDETSKSIQSTPEDSGDK